MTSFSDVDSPFIAAFDEWYADGCQVTEIGVPHAVKQCIIVDWAAQGHLTTLVETGTCHGAMCKAVANHFDSIHTIEMHQPNYRHATIKLKPYEHIKTYLGDSAEVLRELVVEIEEPALFFLDAHYSGGGTARGEIDTPVLEELRIIASRKQDEDIVIVDDRRLFKGEAFHTEDYADYPTEEQLLEIVCTEFSNHHMISFGDSFIIEPR